MQQDMNSAAGGGRLRGQVALVTGAGRGFGRAIALRLASEGAAVALLSRSIEQLQEVVAVIRGGGGTAIPIAADVTNRAEVERACATTRAGLGPVTFLVNCAGVPGPFGPVGELDPEEWWAAQKVHQLAPLLFSTALLPDMMARQSGRILNINATAAVVVAPYMSAYCVGKAAQLRLTEIMDAEARGAGVRVFALQPGLSVTALAEETAARSDAQKWIPGLVSRLNALRGTPEGTRDLEVCAALCVRICSGEFDALAGRYLDVKNDFEQLLREAAIKE
jgi:NAD(P)-dependent dehydrogenase (short-subunit alcohol dehydrogenase family)